MLEVTGRLALNISHKFGTFSQNLYSCYCVIIKQQSFNPYANMFIPPKTMNAICLHLYWRYLPILLIGILLLPDSLQDGVTSCSTRNPNATPFVPLSDIVCENGALAALLIIILILSAFLICEIINISSKHENDDASPRVILSNLRINNINKIIIGHLNINSIQNKFEHLKYLIVENLNVLLISETKLNNTFPQCQFLLHGFHTPYREDHTPYREDHTDKGGGLLLYVRDHITCRNIKFNFCTAIEAIVVEINLKKRKWLLICSYNPNKAVIDKHLNCIGKLLNDLYKKYKNVLL